MPAPASTDTTDVVHPDTPLGRSRRRHRRFFSWLTVVLLATVMASAVVDGFDVADIWGVDEATVAGTAHGTHLRVRYPSVTRPALASPFDIVVERPGGFDRDIELAVDLGYLGLWDLNGVYPAPKDERSDGDRIVWTFEAPDGDVLRVLVDARIEPGAQLETRRGSVALLEPGGAELVVRFGTKVRP